MTGGIYPRKAEFSLRQPEKSMKFNKILIYSYLPMLDEQFFSYSYIVSSDFLTGFR